MVAVAVVEGGLFDQTDVDALVNARNRNLAPAAPFTIVAGSRAILHAARLEPYRELRRHLLLALADLVTGAGTYEPYHAPIHVAAIHRGPWPRWAPAPPGSAHASMSPPRTSTPRG
jgi:hypothetical protein